ncbi:phosphoenolpyruvate carboxykinase (GTP) [Tessaracoccus sp. OS52]|nr:phosphoenolpyruvate carboxykinase (GTP) [Tessaracoccus sp. OS52]MCC2594457.1 phosphoenolpyruvate carboxykinase (GTP) [Tessaracoccus sp. OS52]
MPTTGRIPTHPGILAWVEQTAAMTTPDAIHYCDGSDEEWDRLVDGLVAAGTVVRLNPERKPNSVYARTDPDDVARVEDQTFICSVREDDAGPTNNWMAPDQMKAILRDRFAGCMRGRTMYVIPFCMGHIDAADPKFGVEITDSAYVAISMRIMTRMGADVLEAMEANRAAFVPALHSVGMPLADGVADVPWPCNDEKYIAHFPEERAIWSYGSGYGGNSLLGKKCYALRIASVMARDEGWLAEHMLILKITSPAGRSFHLCAAFPSACGKTNLAMLQPTIPGWKVETLGDDIAWLRFGDDGRLWAVNPETGLFGVAPGTGADTNPNAMAAVEAGNSIFTNVALTPDGDVWWEGMTKEKPERLIDWKGRPWTPAGPEGGRAGEKAAHPNSRFCTPITQCPILSDEYHNPAGVPIDAIIFGGRRENTIPLVAQSRSWAHGVFMGATCSSETTAAASGAVGVLRRDPMAMLPFIGYHVADYLRHWIDIGAASDEDKLPKIFYVNWFRRDPADGSFLWPGFGENSRVLKWIVERIEGRVGARTTPAGLVPFQADLDVEGLDISAEDVAACLGVSKDEWADELPRLRRWLRSMGSKVPPELFDELWLVAEAAARH